MEVIVSFIGYFLIAICWIAIIVGVPIFALWFIWSFIINPFISIFCKKQQSLDKSSGYIPWWVWWSSFRNHND